MRAEITDINSRIANLIRIATVIDVDCAKALARVDFSGAKSAWLPWITAMAGATSNWVPLEVGSQVLVLSASGSLEQGVILPCLYHNNTSINSGDSDEHKTKYKDGTIITHNTASGETTIKTSGKITIDSQSDVDINTANTVTIKAGTLNLSADSITLDTPIAQLTGSLICSGIVSAKNI